LGSKDIEIRKVEFVTKAQLFFCQQYDEIRYAISTLYYVLTKHITTIKYRVF